MSSAGLEASEAEMQEALEEMTLDEDGMTHAGGEGSDGV